MRDLTQIVAAGVGPIIVISAAGLLCLAFYNRLTAIVTRLRGFDRERLQAQQCIDTLGPAGDPAMVAFHTKVVRMLGGQIEMGTRRAHLIRRTLECLLSTIMCLALCSLNLGLGTAWPALIHAAVPLFVCGLLLLVAAALFALVELRYALRPIELEARLIDKITDQPPQ